MKRTFKVRLFSIVRWVMALPVALFISFIPGWIHTVLDSILGLSLPRFLGVLPIVMEELVDNSIGGAVFGYVLWRMLPSRKIVGCIGFLTTLAVAYVVAVTISVEHDLPNWWRFTLYGAAYLAVAGNVVYHLRQELMLVRPIRERLWHECPSQNPSRN